MSSIVREHRQKLRKKYGVQFILDALRTHYRLGWWDRVDAGGLAQKCLVLETGRHAASAHLPTFPDLASRTCWLRLPDRLVRSGSAPLRPTTCARYRLPFWVWRVSSWSGTSQWMTCRSC